jgi:hypothetical protein
MADTPERNTPDWPFPWMPAFLLAFRNSGNVRASCQAAGITRQLAYQQRAKSARFRNAWDEALEDATDTLEAVAWQRARNGSDYLLWKLLASLRRDKFGDAVKVTIDLEAEARRIAAERGLSPEQAGKIVSLAERLRHGKTG